MAARIRQSDTDYNNVSECVCHCDPVPLHRVRDLLAFYEMCTLVYKLLAHLSRRASISHEGALDVLVAADMLRLPRLVHLSEIALQSVHSAVTIHSDSMILILHQVVDAGNAVPLYLAAVAHGAAQLSSLCEYWMATNLESSSRHEQWSEVSAEVRARVTAQHERALAGLSEERNLVGRIPCLLAPVVPNQPV